MVDDRQHSVISSSAMRLADYKASMLPKALAFRAVSRLKL